MMELQRYFVVVMSLVIFLCIAPLLTVASTCQCYRDTSSMRAGFCSSNYALKGTILRKQRVIIQASSGQREEINPAENSPSDNMDEEEHVTHLSRVVEEYHVLIETNYKGVEQNLGGRIFVIYNDDADCKHDSLEEGNTYVFQLNTLKSFDACDRVDLFHHISETELLEDFSKLCPHQQNKGREDKQKDALFLHSPDTSSNLAVLSGEDITEEERGNYWKTVAKQSKPAFTKWDKKCKCFRKVNVKNKGTQIK